MSEDTKASKVQIKNPKDINKYVQRKKKRGHARKKTMFTTSNYELAKSFDATQDSANKKLKEKKMTIKEMLLESSGTSDNRGHKHSLSTASKTFQK